MNRLFLIALILPLHAYAQTTEQTRFVHLNTFDGLSNHVVNHIYQDKYGYLWVGTLYGLNRFDGQEIKTFVRDVDDPTSIANNAIIWMADGPMGNMWVKAGKDIVSYDPYSESFNKLESYFEILRTDPAFITKVMKDTNGDSWFVIEDRGVTKLGENDQVIQFGAVPSSDVKIASNDVKDIVQAKNGAIWISHAHGLVEMIDPSDNEVKKSYLVDERHLHTSHDWNIFVDDDLDLWFYAREKSLGLYYLDTSDGSSRRLGSESLLSEMVRGVIQRDNGELWIGTDHGGISVVNKVDWSIQHIQNDPNNLNGLASNNINYLMKDRDDGVWIGTPKSGVNYHVKGSNKFAYYKIDRKPRAYNDMSSFAEDAGGKLWIGTNGKGLLSFDRKKQLFYSTLEDNQIKGPNPSVIVSLLYDSHEILWVGTYLHGLYQFDGQRFKKYPFQSIPANDVSIWDLYEDSNGNTWIGTLSNGLIVLDPTTGEETNFSTRDHLPADYITSIEEDHLGRIWIGTGDGLVRYNPHQNSFSTYRQGDHAVKEPISSNSIISITVDSKNRTWVATLDGLNRYDEDTEGFRVFKQVDGLPSNIIHAILEDDAGKLWMSTSHGISSMSPGEQGWDFEVFDMSDGLRPGESFTEDAGLKTRDGFLIFSGRDGFNIFDPDKIEETSYTPNLFFTHLYVKDQKVTPGRSPMKGETTPANQNDLDTVEELTLDYDQNSFRIEFAAISFHEHNRTRYQYKLEGYDRDWKTLPEGAKNVSFSNVAYGQYHLAIRALNKHTQRPENSIHMAIRVLPPFWLTSWAYFTYMVCGITFLYFARKYIVKHERQKAKIENDRKEIERQHQLDLLKIKFFTNVSHDFRTPLSLILAPIERMIKQPKRIKVSELKLVERNAQRLMNLVNQLLDFRKMEAGRHELNRSSGDITRFLKNITDSFFGLSREKNISLSFESERPSFYTMFDRDKLEKIMFNLLSNAFKFTLPEGEVRVAFKVLEKEGDLTRVMIMVSDTGIGIPGHERDLIFNRFFQGNTNSELVNNGTGIGLAITKEFVELHEGVISLESQPGEGSTFVVELPLKEILSDDQAAEELVNDLKTSIGSLPGKKVEKTGLPSALLVEDNVDFRVYLSDNLRQYYNVDTAANGKEAWHKIKSTPPDIVISDVMMPVMDGLKLCEKIKSDPRTSHIPVILLTAKNSIEHQVEGLKAGAIEYVSKPFNFEILLNKTDSTLKFHDQVKKSQQFIKAKPGEIEVESQDEILIKNAVKLVEVNMSNAAFTVKDLSHELGYSRGHLYEKILRITHQTPINFIRNIRMERAADLLIKSQLNVSEIAYQVGYNNPKLFSRYFKSKYKLYPTEFRHNFKDE